jgi:hypothetical protein
LTFVGGAIRGLGVGLNKFLLICIAVKMGYPDPYNYLSKKGFYQNIQSQIDEILKY